MRHVTSWSQIRVQQHFSHSGTRVYWVNGRCCAERQLYVRKTLEVWIVAALCSKDARSLDRRSLSTGGLYLTFPHCPDGMTYGAEELYTCMVLGRYCTEPNYIHNIQTYLVALNNTGVKPDHVEPPR